MPTLNFKYSFFSGKNPFFLGKKTPFFGEETLMNFAAEIYKPGISNPSIPDLNGRKFQDFVRYLEPTIRGKVFVSKEGKFNFFFAKILKFWHKY